jgi:hypothetical protein
MTRGKNSNPGNALSDASSSAYFVLNTYLHPNVFGAVWFKCKERHL